LKNDETEPVRLYALHRMIRAEALTTTPARAAVGFDLDAAIKQGKVDFGQGAMIDLELRVRGYIADLLILCPLAADQTMEDEPPGSGFDFRLRVRVPSTQLLRWLLGAGDNVEVIAPTELRHVVPVQAAKMAGLYAGDIAAAAAQPKASEELARPTEGGADARRTPR
jgi:proteasome accessory factor B